MKNQKGFTLIFSLVMLVGISLIAINLVKTSFMEEKMVGHELARHYSFESNETSVREQEAILAQMTDLSTIPEDSFANAECGIVKVEGVGNASAGDGWIVESTFYIPPPNGYNWGRDRKGSNVALCHYHASGTIYVSVNAIGDDFSKHLGHEGDYLGECGGGNTTWNTCVERFGEEPRRLSWQEYAE